jgi:hypothetical protein
VSTYQSLQTEATRCIEELTERQRRAEAILSQIAAKLIKQHGFPASGVGFAKPSDKFDQRDLVLAQQAVERDPKDGVYRAWIIGRVDTANGLLASRANVEIEFGPEGQERVRIDSQEIALKRDDLPEHTDAKIENLAVLVVRRIRDLIRAFSVAGGQDRVIGFNLQKVSKNE